MGMEIETALVQCPACDWSLEVIDGVLQSPLSQKSQELPETHTDIGKTSSLLKKLLRLVPGEIVITFNPIPDNLADRWGMMKVERLMVDLSGANLAANRAISCAEAKDMVHFLSGPIDLSYLRPGCMDAVVLEFPSACIADFASSFQSVPSLLKPSGRMVIILRDRDVIRDYGELSLDHALDLVPKSFQDLKIELISSKGLKFLFVEHPKPEKPIELGYENKGKKANNSAKH
jgi:hypothetical protein